MYIKQDYRFTIHPFSLSTLSLSLRVSLPREILFRVDIGEFVLVFARVYLPIPLLSERSIANSAYAINLFLVNFTNVRIHITLDSKRRIADGTRKRLLAGVRAGVLFERRFTLTSKLTALPRTL